MKRKTSSLIEKAFAPNILQSHILDQKEQTIHTTMIEKCMCMEGGMWNERMITPNMISLYFEFWIWLAFLSIFDLWAFMCSLFSWFVLLWHAIFSFYLTVGHASLACHLSSLFFSIAILFCINIWERDKSHWRSIYLMEEWIKGWYEKFWVLLKWKF